MYLLSLLDVVQELWTRCLLNEESGEVSHHASTINTAPVEVCLCDEDTHGTSFANLGNTTDVCRRFGKSFLLKICMWVEKLTSMCITVRLDFNAMLSRLWLVWFGSVFLMVLEQHLTGNMVIATFWKVQALLLFTEVHATTNKVERRVTSKLCYIACMLFACKGYQLTCMIEKMSDVYPCAHQPTVEAIMWGCSSC